jgi:anti-sigma factor RsiW
MRAAKDGAEEPEMGATDEPVEESDLHAWVDGRLTPGREKAIETYFAAHPEVRERWRQYAEQKTALRAAFAALATRPIPTRLGIAVVATALVRTGPAEPCSLAEDRGAVGRGNKTRFRES